MKNLKFMLNGDIRIISENSSFHCVDGYDEEIVKADFDSFSRPIYPDMGCIEKAKTKGTYQKKR